MNIAIIFIGTFNSWVLPKLLCNGGGSMSKKDFLIFLLMALVFSLVTLLFVVLI